MAISKLSMQEIASIANFTLSLVEGLPRNGEAVCFQNKQSPSLDRYENHFWVRRQIFTSISITGTSISTPTTVARAAPEDKPNNIVAVAIATSK
jgi:hypothetical protein